MFVDVFKKRLTIKQNSSLNRKFHDYGDLLNQGNLRGDLLDYGDLRARGIARYCIIYAISYEFF